MKLSRKKAREGLIILYLAILFHTHGNPHLPYYSFALSLVIQNNVAAEQSHARNKRKVRFYFFIVPNFPYLRALYREILPTTVVM